MTTKKVRTTNFFFPLFYCCCIQDPEWIKIRIRIRNTANKGSASYIHHSWLVRLVLVTFLRNFFRRLSVFLVAFSFWSLRQLFGWLVDRDRPLEQEGEEHDRDSRRRRIRQVRRICQFVPISRKNILMKLEMALTYVKKIHGSCTEKKSANAQRKNPRNVVFMESPSHSSTEVGIINKWCTHRRCRPAPLPLHVTKKGRNRLNEEFTPWPQWDRRVI